MIVAASGLAREVLDALELNVPIQALLDDDPSLHGKNLNRVSVDGPLEEAINYPRAQFVVCVGSGRTRAAIVDRLALVGIDSSRFKIVQHSSVEVPSSCVVGAGSILLAGVTLTSDVQLGCHVVAMPNAVFTHDDVVEDYATICAGVTLGGGVRVGREAYIGMNSAVRQGVSIGAGAVIGMGAVVLADVPDGETWAGVPARRLGVKK